MQHIPPGPELGWEKQRKTTRCSGRRTLGKEIPATPRSTADLRVQTPASFPGVTGAIPPGHARAPNATEGFACYEVKIPSPQDASSGTFARSTPQFPYQVDISDVRKLQPPILHANQPPGRPRLISSTFCQPSSCMFLQPCQVHLTSHQQGPTPAREKDLIRFRDLRGELCDCWFQLSRARETGAKLQ